MTTRQDGAAILSLWDDVEAAGGSAVRGIPTPISGTMTRRLDQSHELSIRVPRQAGWLDDVNVRDVIRVETVWGGIFEWRVAGITDSVGDDNSVTIMGDPIHVDLRDVGFIKDQTSGGVTFFNLGGVDLPVKQYIDTFVLPTLSDQSINWVTRGTVDSNPRLDVSWERWTPQELMKRLQDETGLEYQLRRNGSTDYQVDLVNEIGSSLSTVVVSDQRNLRSLIRERTREGMHTVIQPMGKKPANAEERATIGFAAWEISQIDTDSPTSGQDTVHLQDRDGGAGPMIEDDQLNDLYLLLPDGTLEQILDSTESDQTVVVGDASAASVGDDVEVRADSSGTLLNELESPSGISAIGRVAGTYELDSARGERNYIPNPFASDWTTPGTSVHGLADGAQSSSAGTIDVKGLPAGESFSAGDVVWYADSDREEITANATADGSGNVTLTVSDNPTLSDGDTIRFFHLSPPDGWSEVNDTNQERDIALTVDPDESGQLSCNLNGAHSSDDVVDPKNLTSGDVIYSGDWFDIAGTKRAVLDGDTADGSGNATVALAGTISGSDGDSVTVTRGTWAARTFKNMLAMPSGDNFTPSIQTPSIGVKPVTGFDNIHVSVGLTLRSLNSITVDGNSHNNVQIKLRDTDAGSTLKTLQDDDRTLGAESETDLTLRFSYNLTSTTNLAVRIEGIQANTGEQGWDSGVVYVRWVMLHIGDQQEVLPVWGSYATRLWQDGNRTLDERRSWPTVYDVSVREMRELWDLDPAEEALQLGGSIRLNSPELSIDQTIRVKEVTYDLTDAENTRVVLDTVRSRLTTQVNEGRAKPLFAEIDVEVQDGEVKQSISTSEDPPTKEGTRRSVGDPDDETGVNNPTDFTPLF